MIPPLLKRFTVVAAALLLCSCTGPFRKPAAPAAASVITRTEANGAITTTQTAPVIDPIKQAHADAVRSLFAPSR